MDPPGLVSHWAAFRIMAVLVVAETFFALGMVALSSTMQRGATAIVCHLSLQSAAGTHCWASGLRRLEFRVYAGLIHRLKDRSENRT